MSHGTIKDGTGGGYVAKVDPNNRLSVLALSEPESKGHSVDGRAFSWAVHNVPVPANTPITVWWLRFDDPNRKFFLNTFFVGWNGGNTTFQAPLDAHVHTGGPEPTGRRTTKTMGNLNFTSSQSALATGWVWDGTGAGLEIASPGLLINSMKFAKGMTHVPIAGTMILGRNNTLASVLTSPEAGVYSTVMSGWFE